MEQQSWPLLATDSLQLKHFHGIVCKATCKLPCRGKQYFMDSSQLSIGVAFVAGLASFLSPCVLPLVPIFIAQMVGQSVSQSEQTTAKRLVTFTHSLMFVAGFTLAF